MGAQKRTISVETVDSPSLLNHLDYVESRAEIMVPGVALAQMPFVVDRFIEDDEYWALVDRIKASGYNSAEPIHIRPSRGGVWLVDVDDAARYMAAKHVAGDFFTNLFAQKVRKVRFVLHDTSIDGRHKAPQFEFGGE
jgi:hypothetical protein